MPKRCHNHPPRRLREHMAQSDEGEEKQAFALKFQNQREIMWVMGEALRELRKLEEIRAYTEDDESVVIYQVRLYSILSDLYTKLFPKRQYRKKRKAHYKDLDELEAYIYGEKPGRPPLNRLKRYLYLLREFIEDLGLTAFEYSKPMSAEEALARECYD